MAQENHSNFDGAGRRGTRCFAACLAAAGLLAALLWPPAAWAHSGAPYLVLLEKPVGPYVASVLADPDVGEGTFYVLVTLAAAEPVPEGTAVSLWVTPHDGHLAEASYTAQRRDTRYGERFVAVVPFDAPGDWQVRLAVDGPAGPGETSFPLEVTPAGINWLTTLACLLPFVVAGLIWLRATLRRRPAA